MDLPTPQAAVLSPTRMSAQSKLLARQSQAPFLAPRLAVFAQNPNLLPYYTSSCKIFKQHGSLGHREAGVCV